MWELFTNKSRYYKLLISNFGENMDTCYDLWIRNMNSNKTSEEEAGSGPMKHGDIVVKHHEERQDPEWGNKSKTGVKDTIERECSAWEDSGQDM